MFLENKVRKGKLKLRNCKKYLHVCGFRKMFSKFEKFRGRKNGEITAFVEWRIHLVS
jgi:hypothetical protein